MRKTNIKASDIYSFTDVNNIQRSFRFSDIIPLDVCLHYTTYGIMYPENIECNGIIVIEQDFPIALPLRINMLEGIVESIDVLEYND